MKKEKSVKELSNSRTKKTFWAISFFYFLIAFEFAYMASPFAIYFYSVYKPGLNFINGSPTLAWLSTTFLPHIIVNTSSSLVNFHNIAGAILTLLGFIGFCVGAVHVYYSKITKKGAVIGGIYNIIRHPQYVALVVLSFGMLILWPRYIVLVSFITMLFAYYFLAKVEEDECERKFGESYVDYKNRTNMFLPFRIPFVDKLPGLPKSGIKRYAVILVLYAVTVVSSIVIASGLRSTALNSLYALDSKDAVYISVAKVTQEKLTDITKIALASPEVQSRLNSVKQDNQDNQDNTVKYLNYVLPVEWFVSEIPMNPIESGSGHEFPADYNNNLWKIIFTKAEMQPGSNAEGRRILLHTAKRVPIVEVWVDLNSNQITDIKETPVYTKYGDMPLPLY